MVSFQAKIGWKNLRKKIKIIVPFHSYPRVVKNSKKITKKLKNTIVASFQAKIGQGRMKK